MTSNLITLPCVTTLDLQPERVLNAAVGKVHQVLVVGQQEDGKFYFASTSGDRALMLWLLERARQHVMRGVDED